MPESDIATQYLERLLGTKFSEPLSKGQYRQLRAALRRAEKIRDFEISLYWTRSAYFWGMQVALFGASGLIIDGLLSNAANSSSRQELLASSALLITAILGALISLVWRLMASGAKFWQDNWERHIDVLETFIYGPLYKTYFVEDRGISVTEKFKPISVSKANKFIASSVTIFWTLSSAACLFAIWNFFPDVFPKQNFCSISLTAIVYIVACASTYYFLSRRLRMTNFGRLQHIKTGSSGTTHRLVYRSLLTKD